MNDAACDADCKKVHVAMGKLQSVTVPLAIIGKKAGTKGDTAVYGKVDDSEVFVNEYGTLCASSTKASGETLAVLAAVKDAMFAPGAPAVADAAAVSSTDAPNLKTIAALFPEAAYAELLANAKGLEPTYYDFMSAAATAPAFCHAALGGPRADPKNAAAAQRENCKVELAGFLSMCVGMT